MTETSPAEFSIEDWLTDAHLPEDSADVYKRPDVISELSALKRRIALESDAVTVEKTAGTQRAATLEAEYEKLLHTFADSKLTVYVRALTRDEMKDLRAAHATAVADKVLTDKESNELFGYDLLAKAIIGVRPVGKERQPATFTPAKVKALEEAIGAVQLPAILEARQRAQNEAPAVDADFLRRPSGTPEDNTQE